jgi:hypothetical protein
MGVINFFHAANISFFEIGERENNINGRTSASRDTPAGTPSAGGISAV